MASTYKEASKKNKAAGLGEKPDNVSVESWNKALDLYKMAESKGDAYPELTVAQAILETGWFKSPSGNHNYFGQKATNSQAGTSYNTKEVSNGSSYNTSSRFRDYSNLGEAVDDRMKKWGSKYKDAANVEEALYSIWSYDEEKGQGVGYATDDKYDEKIINILGQIGTPVEKTYKDKFGSLTYAGATPPTQTEVVDEKAFQEKEVDNTAVASNQDRLNLQLLEQNQEILTKLNTQEAEKAASNKAAIAQQNLDRKVSEKNFLKELIMNSGVKTMEAPKRNSQDYPEPNSPGYPNYFQDGGKYEKFFEGLSSFQKYK
jgi:hypothetical protein